MPIGSGAQGSNPIPPGCLKLPHPHMEAEPRRTKCLHFGQGSEVPVKPEISKHKRFPLMLMLHQPQSQGYEQIKDILGGPYLIPQLPAAASGWLQPYLPCLVLLQLEVGIEVLPTPGTGPCPQFLGVGRQEAALSSTLGGGPRVPAWAEGQLSPEIAEPGHPLSF